MTDIEKKLRRIRDGLGFIAALDQSGGSTPKALEDYGISSDEYDSVDEMFDLVHGMRSRVITNQAFNGDRILGTILFIKTMERLVDGMPTATYLWKQKEIVSFLKVDQGMIQKENGVQLMKDMDDLDEILEKANSAGIFGTKMRSVIHEPNRDGIEAIADQQFNYSKRIMNAGLTPIIEPEVNIHADDKSECEAVLRKSLLSHLDRLPGGHQVMLKLTLPEKSGFYISCIQHPRVLRAVALSGGYDRDEANDRLAKNSALSASFSRALLEGLSAQQTEEEFTGTLDQSIESIYKASIT